jgi:hypothetical protein
MNESSERTILEEGDIKITNQRAIIGTKTYALSDLIYARITKDSSLGGCTIIVFVSLGVVLELFTLLSPIYNLEIQIVAFICFGAAIVALLVPPNYVLQIRSLSGQVSILRSMDEYYLRRIVDAINNAILRRNARRD